MARHYDWVIVGAGFTGAVLAQLLASQSDRKVLVIDKRSHIAGNAFDDDDGHGGLLHRYGPHIFHTNSAAVWTYLSQFTEWRPYFHRVLGHIDGHLVPIPFNLDSIAALFPPAYASRLSDMLIEQYGFGARVTILKMRESPDAAIKALADFVYAKVFEGYTTKQWGMKPEALNASVTARVPLLISRDPRYFQDVYQAMPVDGYTAMFKRILDHPNIEVRLNTDWAEMDRVGGFDRVVYTGPIDEFFGFRHGALPYRSLRFAVGHHPGGQRQPVGTVNYPNEFDFTRTTEMSHLTGKQTSVATLVTEFPEAYVKGRNDPYYPIPTPETSQALAPYLDEAAALDGRVWFAGRLGDYAYYNMDQACGRALALFEKKLAAL